MKAILYPALIFLVFLTACHSSKPEGLPTNETQTPSFNKNECFVRARILKTAVDTAVKEGPCANYACLAKVKVKKVIRCGQIISGKPAKGQERWVRFRYTLSEKTGELFPNLQFDLPGLDKGELFDAIWEFRPAMEGENTYPIIYDYRKV